MDLEEAWAVVVEVAGEWDGKFKFYTRIATALQVVGLAAGVIERPESPELVTAASPADA